MSLCQLQSAVLLVNQHQHQPWISCVPTPSYNKWWLAVLEVKMKLEIQGDMHRMRKSGRYNVSDTPHVTPHLRWPNESCVIGTARKRVTFDELSLGQFVIGFVNNVTDMQHVLTMKNMLLELVETVKRAENISWPIARGAFAASMLKIEDESIS